MRKASKQNKKPAHPCTGLEKTNVKSLLTLYQMFSPKNKEE